MKKQKPRPNMTTVERGSFEQRLEILQIQNAALEKSVKNLEERMIHCPLTGLYNKEFFEEYMQGALDVSLSILADGALLYLFVDTMSEIKIRLGSAAADETIIKMGAFLPTLAPEEAIFFRLSGDLFAAFIAGLPDEHAAVVAERIRAGIEGTDIFASRVTVSVGVTNVSELHEEAAGVDRRALVEKFMNHANLRLGIAQRMGGNAVIATSDVEAAARDRKKILLADPDAFRRSLTRELLGSHGFTVQETNSGVSALEIATRDAPSLVIAEYALPGLDAISLRERMREQTKLARVPFMMIVNRKSADEATRAYSLGISVILQRPILIAEFLGLATNLAETGDQYVP